MLDERRRASPKPLPTPNHAQSAIPNGFPTTRPRCAAIGHRQGHAAIGSWALGVAWELGVGNWELSGDDFEASGGGLFRGIAWDDPAIDDFNGLVDSQLASGRCPFASLGADLPYVVAGLAIRRDTLAVAIDGSRSGVVRGE